MSIKELILLNTDAINHFDPLKIKGNYSEVWPQVCKILILRAEHKCECCGKNKKRLTIHHKDNCPLNNAISNLEVLCYHCHGLRHGHIQALTIPYTIGDNVIKA